MSRIFLYRNGTVTDISSMGPTPAWMIGDDGMFPLTFCSVNSSGTAAFWGQNDNNQRFVASADGSSISLYWFEPADRFANKIDGPEPEGGACQFTDAGEMIIGGKMISGSYTVFK